jgi:AraC-like DNA-binding protein
MDFSTRHIFKLLELLEQKGYDIEAISNNCKLDIDKIINGEQKPAANQVSQLWQEAVDITKEQSLGLQLGEHYNFMALGLVGNVIQNAETIENALEHTIQFSNLLTDLLTIELEKEAKYFRLKFIPNPECLLQYKTATIQTIQTSMAFALKEYQLLVFQKIKPRRAEFAISIDRHFDYQRIFKCEIVDNSTQFALEFDNQFLNKKIVDSDYKLLNLLTERANELLSKKYFYSTKRELRKVLIKQFNNGFISIDDAARFLHLSSRTLQRKLSKEQTSFNRVLDEVKKDFAIFYLKRNVKVKEITTILGYKNVSSFSRSFKKWAGVSPINYKI